ncbi:MAG: ABC transporter ATP-binding protein [Acholeplasma sp.]|nr:ABC transporter ATP-binding protein [Acholeplasma sp.]
MQANRRGPGSHGAMGAKPKNFKKSMKVLIIALKPFRKSIVIALSFAAFSTVFNIAGPRLIGEMTNHIQESIKPDGPNLIAAIDWNWFNMMGFVLLALYVLSYLFNIIQSFILTKVTQRFSQKLRKDISIKINKLPLSYFDKRSYGDVLSIVTNDVDLISSALNQSVTQLITSITAMIGIAVMMLTISPLLTLVAFITLPLSFLLIKLIMGKSKKYFRAQQQTLGALNGHIEEVYSGHQLIKVFGAKKTVDKPFNEGNESLEKSAYKSQFLSGLMMPLMGFIGNLSYIAVSVLGGVLAASHTLGIGDIIAMIQYNRRFTQPMSQIAQALTQLQSAAAASERVFEFLSETEMLDETNLVNQIDNQKGKVTFEHVSFGYLEDQIIIKDFNLEAKPGQKIAIVGPTGAGKTTLVNLLMKFYEIDKGDITIDGISIHDMNRETVHKQFGMVLQDAWLFTGSIYDNLRYGNPKATIEEVKQKAKLANIDHFIESLPDGYNHIISDESGISQGQRQLLTIARAMVTNAPMLILDEATSSVDTRTEVLIQEAMDRLMLGRTSFVIAHRLSTIKNADVILVMKDGDIIESGNHQALMTQAGFYANLYQSQFERKNQYATES